MSLISGSSSKLAAPNVGKGAATIRIASNPWLENATLNALMDKNDYFRECGAKVTLVEAQGAAGPFDAIDRGEADICMVSGYSQVLPRIEQGARVRVVGVGMRKPALAVFAPPDKISAISDLRGKTVAVGPAKGLLQVLMVQLLKEARLDPWQVRFVDVGSNEKCFRAVADGDADACCASISYLNNSEGIAVLPGGEMWTALPRYVFQLAYASCAAITDKHQELVAVMAAFGKLYDYLMNPESRYAYFAARECTQANFEEASALASWDFIQRNRPYSRDLSLTEHDIQYLQKVFIGLGTMKRMLSFDEVANMSAASDAARLLEESDSSRTWGDTSSSRNSRKS